jgi:ankyrin repeat protein
LSSKKKKEKNPRVYNPRRQSKVTDMFVTSQHELIRNSPAGVSQESVLELLEKGADVNGFDDDNEVTPLMWACGYYRSAGYVVPLLELGADVNYVNNFGDTPLLEAVRSMIDFGPIDTDQKQHDDHFLLETLLDAGADVNHANSAGWTPLMLVATSIRTDENMGILRLLMNNAHQRTIQNALPVACKWNNTQIVNELLRHGANIDSDELPDYVKLLDNNST